MRRIAVLVAALAISGCVTTQLKPGAESVRITSNPEVVRGCKVIGEVRAADRMNGGMVGQDAAEENTYRRLRNAAVDMGANVVYLERAGTGYYGASARGEAYICGG